MPETAILVAVTKYRKLSHSLYYCVYHIVWTPKYRFRVLEPFSFVFLLSGNNQYHLVWETLDTEEATYVWHIDKSLHELERGIKKINGVLGQIRLKGGNSIWKQTLNTLVASYMIILMISKV